MLPVAWFVQDQRGGGARGLKRSLAICARSRLRLGMLRLREDYRPEQVAPLSRRM